MDKIETALELLGKKYAYRILRFLENKPKQRFKDIAEACPIEKMRSRRLRELEDFELIEVSVERIGRKHVSVYSISKKGKMILKTLNQLNNL